MHITISIMLSLLFYTVPGIENDKPTDLTSKCLFLSYDALPMWCCGMAQLQDELVFRDEKAFSEFQKEVCAESCKKEVIVGIDFSKYSLLVKWSRGTYCEVDYQRVIMVDHKAKKLLYSISSVYGDDCHEHSVNGNFVLVPKIPEDYTVEFKLEQGPPNSPVKSAKFDSLIQIGLEIERKIEALQKRYKILELELDLLLSLETEMLTFDMLEKEERELELYGVATYTKAGVAELYKDHQKLKRIVTTIPGHHEIRVLEKYWKFYKVRYMGKEGWLNEKHILRNKEIEKIDDQRPMVPEQPEQRVKPRPLGLKHRDL